LNSELLKKEEEIHELRAELSSLHQQRTDMAIALEKLEKTVINELNSECKKTANILGVTPRRAEPER